MKKDKLKYAILALILSLCCATPIIAADDITATLTEEGISWNLAQHRKDQIGRLKYHLSLKIDDAKEGPITGTEEISFDLKVKDDVILDFNESADRVHKVEYLKAAGRKEVYAPCPYRFSNGHIIIPRRCTRVGSNTIRLTFTAGQQGLNRRDGYLYTLFVPDRAHSVFPCFDQPNLKAKFSLDLDIPESWQVAQNGLLVSTAASQHPGHKVVSYRLDRPIPTYLFAFAAGDFQYTTYKDGARTIGAYYRETDPARVAQLPDILREVMFALEWLEDFTRVKYPFPKYDLVILPGFQFGGMEHVGATFYNDNRLFLSANPTADERLSRTQLISHETAHMWFGDAVTMDWFNDVWTKEVFANYFAAQITEPLFPELNHDLNFLRTYQGAAISQDRTEGRTSIRQDLDNMRYAGLIYNNIIYNKAPVMMRKMVEIMGKENFRRGIQRYVHDYLYYNATWDDIIGILDEETGEDLLSFSRDWVDTARWPQHEAASWDDDRIGREYGFFRLTEAQADSTLHGGWAGLKGDDTRRQAILMNLYENYLAKTGGLTDQAFMSFILEHLATATDPLLASTLTSYAYQPMSCEWPGREQCERQLWHLSQTHAIQGVRTGLLRLLMRQMQSEAVVDSLYNIWSEGTSPLLSINDLNTLTYELAIRRPHQAQQLIQTQLTRNSDPDRRRQFEFVSRAVHPDASVRDALFESFKDPANRRIEPWTLSALSYLNHPLRQREAVGYIRPALEMLSDIQKTGDIFMPANWCSSLLAGHTSAEAMDEVEAFLKAHPDMMPLLRNKVMSAAYYLIRANKK